MFAGDTESLLQPIAALGVAGLLGAIFVLSVAFAIGYIVYLQSKSDRSEH